MEKVLQYYGFKVRHVTLIQTSNIGFLGVFIPSNSGHSVTEVLTSKG